MLRAFISLFLLSYCSFVFGKSLSFKIVEEGVGLPKEVSYPLPVNHQAVWKGTGWKCEAISVSPEWGTFFCKNKAGLSVSTRFHCERNNSFETSRSFAISEGKKYNVGFSLWCQ